MEETLEKAKVNIRTLKGKMRTAMRRKTREHIPRSLLFFRENYNVHYGIIIKLVFKGENKMKHLFSRFIRRRCELIIEKENVADILDAINKHTSEPIRIGSCGWVDQPSKWFIMFDATEGVWIDIKMNLRKGNFKEIKETLKDSFGNDVFQNI
jgi:hypothetical protein